VHNYSWLVSSHVLVGGIAVARSQFAVTKRQQDLCNLLLAVRECCIVSARRLGEPAAGSPLGRADGGLGWSDTIVLVGDHDEWAPRHPTAIPGV
jgi:hypothetical protein